MITIGIYKISDNSNNVYIGQSWNIEHRKLAHSYGSIHYKGYTILYNCLKKYGWNNFKFEILHVLPEDIDQSMLDNYEILYWELYNNCGFNMLNTKYPGSKGKHNEETKEKIKLGNTGERNPMYNIGTKHPMYGKKHKPESIEKFKINNKGEGNPMYGKKKELCYAYGTMWITNGIENLRIEKENNIPGGFKKGRIFFKKFNRKK